MLVSSPAVARRALNVLLGQSIVATVIAVLALVIGRLPISNGRALDAGLTLGFLSLAAGLVAGLLMLAGALDRPGLVLGLVGVVLVVSGIDVVSALLRFLNFELGLGAQLIHWPMTVLGLVERVLYLFVLVRLCGDRLQWPMVVGFVGVCAALVHPATNFALSSGVFSIVDIHHWYPYFSMVVMALGLGSLMALVIAAREAVSGASAPGHEAASAAHQGPFSG